MKNFDMQSESVRQEIVRTIGIGFCFFFYFPFSIFTSVFSFCSFKRYDSDSSLGYFPGNHRHFWTPFQLGSWFVNEILARKLESLPPGARVRHDRLRFSTMRSRLRNVNVLQSRFLASAASDGGVE